jgi:NEDD8-activating enzyme E1 regulatory subunit
MNSIHNEVAGKYSEDAKDDIMSEAWDPASSVPWLMVLKAYEKIRDSDKPTIGNAIGDEDDLNRLKAGVETMRNEFGLAEPIDEKFTKEVLRFGNSKLHNISAFLGGMGAQEAVKLIMGQYIPMNNTFIFDGIHGRGQVFEL